MRRPNARSPPSVPDPTPQMHHHKSLTTRHPNNLRRKFRFSIVILLIFLTFFYICYSKLHRTRYAIIIDGGSTGTRIHVFAYCLPRGISIPAVDFTLTAAMKAVPGLSAYANSPEAAGESLVDLLDFAKTRVPQDRWRETDLRLMATAGLRLLDLEVQDRILGACRKMLRRSGFMFKDEWASVISGPDEGIYAWVAANYALGTLGSDPQKTSGIIELGGASAQVTLVSSEPLPEELSHELKFGDFTYNLYSQSFLHLGQNVAYESLREMLRSGVTLSTISGQSEIIRDPCAPKGYNIRKKLQEVTAGALNSNSDHQFGTHAFGNFTECRSAALSLLRRGRDKCLYKQCLLGSSFIPKLQGRFLATENFFYTSKFFGLGPTAFLSDLMLAGENFCGEDWINLQMKHHKLDEEELVRYCFSSAYIIALLHDSLGIDLNDPRIEFTNQIGDVPLDWALGAFIIQKASKSTSADVSYWPAAETKSNHPLLLYLVIILFVLVLATWSVSRWKRSRSMTIYDMEKGRYIVKRISS